LGQVIGHWKTLVDAQYLTQEQLLPGVTEQDIWLNNPIERVAVALALGKSIKWNREKVVMDGDISSVDIGQQMTWSSSIQYDQMEVELKRKAVSRILDSFIADVYGTVNNYEAQVLWEMKKGMARAIGKSFVYDDTTYGGALQMDGLHAWAATNDVAAAADGVYDIDMAAAPLSIGKVRLMLSNMKQGCDYILIPPCLGLRVDAAYEEAGFAGLASGTAGTMMGFTRGIDEIGNPIMYFQAKPLVRTDYLVKEQADTGRGTTLRAPWTSGTVVYSLFGVKSGDVFAGQPGVTLAFGNPEMKSKLYKTAYFAELEDYDARGLRLVSYINTLVGSKLCLTRIHDITDATLLI
jgi:hypothetical protein